jgi:hypothetical protein
MEAYIRKNHFFKLIILLFCAHFSYEQIGINTSGAAPAPSAMLDVTATDKGFLPPRMTMSQRNAISATNGLMVYCTDCNPAGHFGYNAGVWKPMFDYQTASGPCVQYTVGQQAQGGTVIWVDDSGQHGLVAAPTDIFKHVFLPGGDFDQFDFPWASIPFNTVFAVASRGGIYGGQSNTEKIIDKMGWAEYSAFLCSQGGWSGYGDWYLPSLNEMLIMYTNRSFLPTPLKETGLVNYEYYYWTSTEAANNTAFCVHTGPGTYSNYIPVGGYFGQYKERSYFAPLPGGPGFYIHTRAVRRF